jgi:peptide-methionine (R)-S-oxide reductase
MSRTRLELCTFLSAAISFVVLAATAAGCQDAPGSAATIRSEGTQEPNNPKSDAASDRAPEGDGKAKAEVEPEFVRKTDVQWKKILTRSQYAVTRQRATEPPFSGKYATGHFRGNFVCVCCGATLFSAQTKFDSGTGWPSFYRPANARSIQTAWDYDGAEPRVEVTCRRCGAHLGHVFDDGPPPTGLRFCINSVAIQNKPPDGESAAGQSPGRSKAKTAASARIAASPKTKPAAKSNSKSKSTATETTPPNGSTKSSSSSGTQPTDGNDKARTDTQPTGKSDKPSADEPSRPSDN